MSYTIKTLVTADGCALIVDSGDNYVYTINPRTVVDGVPTTRMVARCSGDKAGDQLSMLMSGSLAFNSRLIHVVRTFEFSRVDAVLVGERRSNGALMANVFGILGKSLHHLQLPLDFVAGQVPKKLIKCLPITDLEIDDRNRTVLVRDTSSGQKGWELTYIAGFDPTYGSPSYAAEAS